MKKEKRLEVVMMVVISVIAGLLANTIFRSLIEPFLNNKALSTGLPGTLIFLLILLLTVFYVLREIIPTATEKTKRSIVAACLNLGAVVCAVLCVAIVTETMVKMVFGVFLIISMKISFNAFKELS